MNALRAIAEWRTPFFDGLFSILTKLGEETIIIAILCILFWCVNKKLAYSACFAYFISTLTVQGMKIGFRVDRPWVLDPSFKPVESALKHATGYSFPSGHTQSAATVYGALGCGMKKTWLKILCFLSIPIVGFSRMYLGVHTPADVCAAIIISAIAVSVVYFLYSKEKLTPRAYLVFSIIFIAASAGLFVYAYSLYKNGVIEYKYVADCCKAIGAALGFALSSIVETRYIKFDVRTKHLWQQIVKLVIGVGVLVALKSGIKAIFGASLVVDTLRYMLLIIWIIAVWPAIFNKLFAPDSETVSVTE